MVLARAIVLTCLAAPASPFLLRQGNVTRQSAENVTQITAKLPLNKTAKNATQVAAQKPPAGSGKQVGLSGAAAEVTKLRAKLSKVAAALSTMLDAKEGLSTSKVGESMSAFVAHLQDVVQETAGMNDTALALRELHAAQAGMSGLVAKMTSRQEELAKEDVAQQQSLLMGVLMTRQHESMEKQLVVLKSDDFRRLPVVVAVLAAHDTKTPLFQQVAAYLDQHRSGVPATAVLPSVEAPPALPAKLKAGKDGKPDVSPIVQALAVQLHHMEETETREASLHRKIMKQLEAAVAKATKKNPNVAKTVRLMERAEKHKYAKQNAMADNDIKNIKKAIEAVKRGDVQGLERSEAALATSMKAMEAHSGTFIYLIQLAHRAAGLDCPYCAAQCIEKCHTDGRPYAMCLTQCADAGK